jgi:hypothetical protein
MQNLSNLLFIAQLALFGAFLFNFVRLILSLINNK